MVLDMGEPDKMPRTLLLCFVHGFKGDEETFFEFPSSLQRKVASQCPQVDVQTRVYPKYETRGDLAGCVETFKEWLQEQVASIELAAGNKSAILNPNVGIVLVGHSMGGFVAVDTLFLVLDKRPVSPDPEKKLMFPLIYGVLLFDTPLNGLARPMFAYGAFTQYQNISGVFNVISAVSSSIAMSGASTGYASTAGVGGAVVASQARSWRRWQVLASRTGAYGAIMAGGVAAYTHRQQIYNSISSMSMPTRESLANIKYKDSISQGLTYVSRDAIGEGFAWMASHLKFVGALMKTGQLTQRQERLEQLQGIGIINMYTSLGENGYWNGGYFVPKRSFCAVPNAKSNPGLSGGNWKEIANLKAGNEIEAHCSMFKREKNDGYDAMLDCAIGLVCQWVSNDLGSVVDGYIPSREVMNRSISETNLLDDDGKVLDSSESDEKKDSEESEDEKQLKAILKCADMPVSHEEEEAVLAAALEVPLPVDETEIASQGADSIEAQAFDGEDKVPLPRDQVVNDVREHKNKSVGWGFKNPLPFLYGNRKAG